MSIQDAAIQSWQNAARKAKAEGKEMFTRKSRCRDKKEILRHKADEDALVYLLIDCANKNREAI
jgi:hypothetical protein